MTSNPIFRGVATALITPLNESGIDFSAFARLIDWQIAEGVAALVIAGTTGEGSTLTDEEHRAAVRFAVEHTAGRVPVIAGTGSNDTAYAVDLTKYCCEVGADAMLVVTPYYNKATQNGLIKMYTTIADASTKPLILLQRALAHGREHSAQDLRGAGRSPEHSGHKGVASGNISQIVELASLVGDRMDIYSGQRRSDNADTRDGRRGRYFCLVRNVLPRRTNWVLCDRFFSGDVAGSAELPMRAAAAYKRAVQRGKSDIP